MMKKYFFLISLSLAHDLGAMENKQEIEPKIFSPKRNNLSRLSFKSLHLSTLSLQIPTSQKSPEDVEFELVATPTSPFDFQSVVVVSDQDIKTISAEIVLTPSQWSQSYVVVDDTEVDDRALNLTLSGMIPLFRLKNFQPIRALSQKNEKSVLFALWGKNRSDNIARSSVFDNVNIDDLEVISDRAPGNETSQEEGAQSGEGHDGAQGCLDLGNDENVMRLVFSPVHQRTVPQHHARLSQETGKNLEESSLRPQPDVPVNLLRDNPLERLDQRLGGESFSLHVLSECRSEVLEFPEELQTSVSQSEAQQGRPLLPFLGLSRLVVGPQMSGQDFRESTVLQLTQESEQALPTPILVRSVTAQSRSHDVIQENLEIIQEQGYLSILRQENLPPSISGHEHELLVIPVARKRASELEEVWGRASQNVEGDYLRASQTTEIGRDPKRVSQEN